MVTFSEIGDKINSEFNRLLFASKLRIRLLDVKRGIFDLLVFYLVLAQPNFRMLMVKKMFLSLCLCWYQCHLVMFVNDTFRVSFGIQLKI